MFCGSALYEKTIQARDARRIDDEVSKREREESRGEKIGAGLQRSKVCIV
jgi:hypothetical protein